MNKHSLFSFLALLTVLLFIAFPSTAATNLKLNQNLNYNSDSDDGPLITGKELGDGSIDPGKPAYVIFYHRECYNSKRQAKRTVELYEKYGDRVKFIVVDLDNNISDEQRSLRAKHYRRYIPHVTVYGKSGKVLYDRSGEVSNQKMSDILDSAL